MVILWSYQSAIFYAISNFVGSGPLNVSDDVQLNGYYMNRCLSP